MVLFTWPPCAQFADKGEIHSNSWDCKKCAYYLVNYLAQGIDFKRGSQRSF